MTDMKRILLLGTLFLAIVSLTAVAGYRLMTSAPAEWTTASPRAEEAFEAALSALKKAYRRDAARHLDRALELDPELAIAKLYAMRLADSDRRQQLEAELRSADLGRLTPREALLIGYALAHRDGEHQRAEAMLAEYLRAHPDDPFALDAACNAAWLRVDSEEAERCYANLIARHSNWVEAQNRLGYLAMGEGRFDEAEERFLTYRYIAPDQANPYDSLGELYMNLGRYQEAEASFRQALEQKPDFCASYTHLVTAQAFDGRPASARASVEAMAAVEACRSQLEHGFRCWAETVIAYTDGAFEAAWQASAGCPDHAHWSVLPHRVALITGRTTAAQTLEKALRATIDHYPHRAPLNRNHLAAALENLTGSWALAHGDAAAAVTHFERADRLSSYWGDLQLTLKLYNRLDLAHALEAAGEVHEAKALRRQIEAVNPHLEHAFGPGIDALVALGAKP